jgi:hypothetical protein
MSAGPLILVTVGIIAMDTDPDTAMKTDTTATDIEATTAGTMDPEDPMAVPTAGIPGSGLTAPVNDKNK